MATTADRDAAQQGKFRVLGTRPVRHDGIEKVTGAARYGADMLLPGTLHGKVLRSPYAHARILSIDTSKAEAVPGVRAVATSADFPIIQNRDVNFAQSLQNPRLMAENDLADKKVLYKGHAVAAVVATSPHEAEEALNLIEVEYEVLPTVLGWREAMKEDPVLLHDTLTERKTMSRADPGEDTGKPGNVASHLQLKLGDVEQGFSEADIVIEREYNTQTVHQGYIEPFACTAQWMPEGRLTIWTSTQGIFGVRGNVAAILDIPESMIKVVPMEIGGGFGGKGTGYLEPVAAVLSRKTGQPVKMVMSRKEVFEGTGPILRQLHPLQDWRQERRHIHRRAVVHGLRGWGLSRLAHGWRRYVRPQRVQAGARPRRRLRRGLQQAQDGRLQSARPSAGVLRRGKLHRRAGADAGHGSHGPPHQERGQGGRPRHHRRASRTRGSPGGDGGHQGASSLQRTPGRPQPRPRRGHRLPAQRRRQRLVCDHQCAGQRHREHHHRLDGPVRHARGSRHAGCRGAGPVRRGRHTPGRRHRLRGLDWRFRRQPHHVRHRSRSYRRSAAGRRPDEGSRRSPVGVAAGRR